MTTDAVIFDLYNTLIDQPEDPIKEMLREAGLKPHEIVTLARKVSTRHVKDIADMLTYVHSIDNAAVHAKAAAVDIGAYEDRLKHSLKASRLFADAIPVMDALRKSGIKVGVISNLLSFFKKPYFDLGLDQHADAVVFSCDVGYRKPDAEIYHIAAAMLGVPVRDILMTGDHYESDVAGPRRAGMRAVMLNRQGTTPRPHITTLYDITGYV